MDFGSSTLNTMLKQRMNWLSARQTVLAQNVANADTPGFRPSDLKAQDFDDYLPAAEGQAAKLRMERTSGSHLNRSGLRLGEIREESERNPYEISPSGNGVVLEEQMMQVGKTGADYQTMTSLYRKQVSMMKTVLGKG